MITEEPYFDKNGIQIKEFSVIKIFHFKGVNDQGRGRKNYYMYKWINIVDGQYVAKHLMDDSGDYFHLRIVADKDRKLTTTEVVQQPTYL